MEEYKPHPSAHLLTHHLGGTPFPEPMFVFQHTEWKNWGIALIIDGYYSDKANAEEMMRYWEGNLRDTVTLLNDEQEKYWRRVQSP